MGREIDIVDRDTQFDVWELHVRRQVAGAVDIPVHGNVADGRVAVVELGHLAEASSHEGGPEPRSPGAGIVCVCRWSARRIARRH